MTCRVSEVLGSAPLEKDRQGARGHNHRPLQTERESTLTMRQRRAGNEKEEAHGKTTNRTHRRRRNACRREGRSGAGCPASGGRAPWLKPSKPLISTSKKQAVFTAPCRILRRGSPVRHARDQPQGDRLRREERQRRFDFAQQLVRAKDPKEIVQLQQEFLKRQVEQMSGQMKELGEHATQTAQSASAAARPKT